MMLILYRLYRFQTAVRFFLSRRILPLGWGLLMALVVASVMMMGSPMRPLYQLSALLVGMVGVAGLWACCRKGRVRVQREIAGHATAGVEFHYGIVVENQGRDLPMAKLLETGVDPRPDFQSFLHAREPSEAQRNVFDRKLAFYRWQWLMQRAILFDAQESESFVMKRGESIRIMAKMKPRRRGVLELDDARLLLPDPLGLFQRAKKTINSTNRVCVLPRRHAVPQLRMLGMPQYQVGEDAASRQTGNGGEFASLREYRSGDTPRMMHWASWAKTGRPIVKEVEDMIFPRYALVLDTFGEAGSEERFEEVVSVAASFASAADTEESMLDLMFLGDRDRVVSAGRGVAPALALLEALAAVRMGYEEKFDGLSRMVVSHGKVITGCLCVFHGWSESRELFLRKLNAVGIPSRGFAVVKNEENQETRRGRGGVAVDFLRSGEIAKDLLRLR